MRSELFDDETRDTRVESHSRSQQLSSHDDAVSRSRASELFFKEKYAEFSLGVEDSSNKTVSSRAISEIVKTVGGDHGHEKYLCLSN